MALDLKSFFANTPPKKLYILGGVLAIAVVALYGWLLMWPLWEEMNTQDASLQKLKTEVAKQQEIASKMPKLNAEIKNLEKQLDAALVKLPEEKDIPKLLTQVNTLGQRMGLEFLLFRPGTPVKKGFYAEMPIDMRVEGMYHTLGGFLDQVSKLERIVNVSDIRITPLSAQSQRPDRAIVSELKATTYTFLEKGGSAGAPEKKK
jgi:type IV pilus assembly protein PilO